MNSFQELLSHGFEESTAESMIDNYKSRVCSKFGCWLLTDINFDFDRHCQMWTFECSLCGAVKTVKKPKMRDVAMTCKCQQVKKMRPKKNPVKLNNDESYLGKVYGNDKIVDFKKSSAGDCEWICECQLCGNTHIRIPYELKSRTAPRCKCQVGGVVYEKLIGEKKNFLTVISVLRKTGEKSMLVCKCDCGKIKKIQPYAWQSGEVKSCGCRHDELLSTHGLSKTRIYRIWRGMNARCYSEKSVAYEYYGGRGIKICDEWIGESGLFAFFDWAMNNGYSDELSIDRIDSNGNYCPANCRWADDKAQASNRRKRGTQKTAVVKRRVFWEIDGITRPAKEWCDEYGVSTEFVRYRMNVLRMSAKEALTLPKKTEGRPRKVVNL